LGIRVLQDENHSPPEIPKWAYDSLAGARVGHLACSTKDGRPLVIPICFAFNGSTIYSAIDEKPKHARPFGLRRITNIVENPKVCFIVDKYSEDWRTLQYVLVEGTAAVLTEGNEFEAALSMLRKKYDQYLPMKLETRPLIKISVGRVITWRASQQKSEGIKPKE
jgi:PPOX class probable F420-dependent enzyme